jgi:transposase
VRKLEVVRASRPSIPSTDVDKGYSYQTIRRWLRRHRVQAVIPERADQEQRRTQRPGRKPHLDRTAYRRRSAIECTVGALKEARAVATRYEKLKREGRASSRCAPLSVSLAVSTAALRPEPGTRGSATARCDSAAGLRSPERSAGFV